jgi:hypothetical protein
MAVQIATSINVVQSNFLILPPSFPIALNLKPDNRMPQVQ